MEKKILRMLVIDDSPDDAELPVDILRQAGYMLKSQRVHDLATLEAALHQGRWDLVISENAMPKFSGAMALDMIKRHGIDAPFLILSRDIADDQLQKLMTSGVSDVVRKQQIGRLLPAIRRELRNAALRQEHYRLASLAEEIEQKQKALIETSREAVAYVHDGVHVDANIHYLKIFGFNTKEELAEVPLLNLIEPGDQAVFKKFFRKLEANSEPGSFAAVRHDGSKLHIDMSISPVAVDGEECVQVIVTDVSKRQAVENKLKHLSQHDPLTGLFGRHYFMHELGIAVTRAQKEHSNSALFYLNVNKLTEINEKVGYAAGDRLLLKISKIISGLTATRGAAGRLGGDEFAILFPIQSDDEGQQYLDSVVKSLETVSFTEGGDNYECSCSISCTKIDDSMASSQKALSTAYATCEQSKTYKKAETRKEATPAPTPAQAAAQTQDAPKKPANANDQRWEKRIKQALDKDLFELSYQPVVSLQGDDTELYEVFLRMDEGGGKLITAAEFMPAAQKSGLIEAIDGWVLQHAIEALANLHGDNRDSSLFVNISKDSFLNKNLPVFTKKALQEAGVAPRHLIIEVDERDLMELPEEGAEMIRQFKSAGCEVSIDNFGTGLGSVELLMELPGKFLKLTGRALQNIGENPKKQAVFKIMVELGRTMGKKIVAKSVEHADALSFLYQQEVEYVQGFYFQEDGSEADYSFDGEATLGSDDQPAPSWSSR